MVRTELVCRQPLMRCKHGAPRLFSSARCGHVGVICAHRRIQMRCAMATSIIVAARHKHASTTPHPHMTPPHAMSTHHISLFWLLSTSVPKSLASGAG